MEAILRAQFELEYAEPEQSPERLARLNSLLDQAIAGTSLTRLELLAALRDRTRRTSARNCRQKPDGEASEPALFDTAFPGGNIIVDRIEENRVELRPDRRDTEGWWFYWYFRARHAAGKTLDFVFTDGAPIGVRGPAVSVDGGKSWNWLGGKNGDSKSFRYTFGPEADAVRFAFAMPYIEAACAI